MILKCQYQYCHKSLDFVLRAWCLQTFFTCSKTSALTSILEFFQSILHSVSWTVGSASLCSFSIHFLFKILLLLCIIMCGNLHGSSSHNLISTTPSYLFPGTNPENEIAVPKDSHERTLWEEEVLHVPSLNVKSCCFVHWGGSHAQVSILLLHLCWSSLLLQFQNYWYKKIPSLCHLSTFHRSLFKGLGSCYFLGFNPYSAP